MRYWSSSVSGNTNAWNIHFVNGSIDNTDKSSTHIWVRPIRSASITDGCIPVLEGCMDETAFNYNADANTDDGSCMAVVNGCIDSTAFNYNADANTDDGSCIAVVNGCIDATAFNYNADANTDDGSCEAIIEGCTDETAFNYNSDANTPILPSIGDVFEGGYVFYY